MASTNMYCRHCGYDVTPSDRYGWLLCTAPMVKCNLLKYQTDDFISLDPADVEAWRIANGFDQTV